MRYPVGASAVALLLTAAACGGALQTRSRVIDCASLAPLGSPPTVAHPLLCARRTTLARAAGVAGTPLVLPRTRVVRPADVGPVWIEGFARRNGHETSGTVALTFPARKLIVEYTRPAPSDGSAAHFQAMAVGLPSSKVVALKRRPALVIRQGSDQTGHNFGVVIFNLDGNEVRVMGHDGQATLEALARSIIARSAGSLPGLTAAKLARLEAMARNAASVEGDSHPSSAVVFASRRHEANIAAGAGSGVPGSRPVYLVVIRGHFTCADCTGPAGAAPPRGDVITMVLDRRTLRVLDGGIGGHVNTSEVGHGVPLRLG